MVKIVRLMTEDMVSNAFLKMLQHFQREKGMTFKEICSKPLQQTLTEEEYAFSILITRALVAFDMGLLSQKDIVDILSGKNQEKRELWFLSLSDEFQEEYEKHWMNITRKAKDGTLIPPSP